MEIDLIIIIIIIILHTLQDHTLQDLIHHIDHTKKQLICFFILKKKYNYILSSSNIFNIFLKHSGNSHLNSIYLLVVGWLNPSE